MSDMQEICDKLPSEVRVSVEVDMDIAKGRAEAVGGFLFEFDCSRDLPVVVGCKFGVDTAVGTLFETSVFEDGSL